MKKEQAIVLTAGLLDDSFAKTAHGLIRGTDRFQIVSIIDEKFHGQDAGEVMDGKFVNIPVFSSIQAYLDTSAFTPKYCIVGVAFPGGKMPESMKEDLKFALKNKMGVVNGLHSFLSDDPEFVQLAADNNVELIDIRKPRPRHELNFWSGEIYNIKTPIIAVLGTDCALGKRTTTRFLMECCRMNQIKAEMIYTGQTGWMQGYPYGFILDSTVNDFVGGEIEKAIVNCSNALDPDVIFLEGQSSLLNPSGPCGSEFILSGNAKGVILQHAPGRTCYIDTPKPMDPIEKHITLIEAYGAQVLGITLNSEAMSLSDIQQYQSELSERLALPVVLPLENGVEELLPVIRQFLEEN